MPGAGGFAQRRPGFGMGLVGGLVAGGLIGGLMGHGFGGWGGGGMGGMGGGFLTILLQLLIFGLIASFVFRLFRRRSPAMAGGFASPFDAGPAPGAGPWGGGFGGGGGGGAPAYSPADEIAVSSSDRAAFERLLSDVQAAFGREDYGALRAVTTPEVMGYLAEELSDNATHGRKNEVSAVRLIRSDVSEAWREGDADYATVALNYESIDVMRDRTTGAVLSGDPDRPTSTTEVWTFVRQNGAPWKLSAIQES
jgi:predicted lipid-binding transport protein (Tim44 family)